MMPEDEWTNGSLLIIVGGRPGVGKSAAAAEIARLLAMHPISADEIADRLIEARGFAAATREAVYAQARVDVVSARRRHDRIVVDGMNPDDSIRQQWRAIGARHFDRFVDVEIRCSNDDVWAKRVEQRVSRLKHITGPDWAACRSCSYEDRTDDRFVFDSARSDVATIVQGIVLSAYGMAACGHVGAPDSPVHRLTGHLSHAGAPEIQHCQSTNGGGG